MSQRPPLQAWVLYPAVDPPSFLRDRKFYRLASFPWGELCWDPQFRIVVGVEQGWWDWECPSTVAVYQAVEELLKRHTEDGLARLLLRRVGRELGLGEDANLEAIVRRLNRLMREDRRLFESAAHGDPAFAWLFKDFYSVLGETVGSVSTNASSPSTSTPPAGTQHGEGEKPRAGRSKGIPLAEAEVRVSEWLEKNAKGNPAAITRDAVAAGTGVSTASVSRTAAWQAFRKKRDAVAKPRVREVPLTRGMLSVMKGDDGRDAELDELASLIEEQRADMAEETRYRKFRI
jgi:hypothetical protein